MDSLTSNIVSASTATSMVQVKSAAANALLRKTLDFQEQQAAQLIQSATLATNPQLGSNVNTYV